MKEIDFSSWPTNAEEAIVEQKRLRSQTRIEDDFGEIQTICGVDVGYDVKNNLSHASVALLERGSLRVIASVQSDLPTTFPYISGLLAFREIPVIVQTLKLLPEIPDILMVDGHGISHPRRMGIAAHLGVLLDIPAFGVAKSRLTGRYELPGDAKGSTSPLVDYKTREIIGTVLRSKEKCNPLFIAPGHRVSHETALNLTLECLTKYRLPEPTRIADKYSKVKHSAQENLLGII